MTLPVLRINNVYTNYQMEAKSESTSASLFAYDSEYLVKATYCLFSCARTNSNRTNGIKDING